ncbi:AAA family ATPase [Yoonia sp. 208BN28-4]|uniref:AAA family ATPase n=1 Tax=Yoonia sp. 208BN28-4 TaxID=3126505 RepID=UPI0030AC6000
MDDQFQKLSEFERKEVEWLWEPLIPRGMMTIIEGDPDVGKSYLAMHIAAEISKGGSLPGGASLKKGRVLYFSQEDDPAYTMRPRIEDMGGKVHRIKVHVGDSVFDENGLNMLAAYVVDWKPDLIIIDPLVGYVGSNVDFFRANEIRPVLRALSDIAEIAKCGLLVIRHLTKGKHDKAMHQGGGSVDFIAFVRSALRVAVHPERDDIRVIAHFKHNLSKRGASQSYELLAQEPPLRPKVVWRGEVDISIDDLHGGARKEPSELDHAIKFLCSELANGKVPSKQIADRADSFGIAKKTLERAKEEIGIKPKKVGAHRFWSLPATK